MELNRTYIPEEIIRHILSYITLPIYRSVCRYLDDMSKEVDTISIIKKKYKDIDECIRRHRWEEVLYWSQHLDPSDLQGH
jgi:hypothetical protein